MKLFKCAFVSLFLSASSCGTQLEVPEDQTNQADVTQEDEGTTTEGTTTEGTTTEGTTTEGTTTEGTTTEGTTTEGTTTALACESIDSNGVPIEYTFKGIGMKTPLRDYVPRAYNIVGACRIDIDQDGDSVIDEQIPTSQQNNSFAPTPWTQLSGDPLAPFGTRGAYHVFNDQEQLLRYQESEADTFTPSGVWDCLQRSPRFRFNYNSEGSLERYTLSVWESTGGDCDPSFPEESQEFNYDSNSCLIKSEFFDHQTFSGTFSKYKYQGLETALTRDSNGFVTHLNNTTTDQDQDRVLNNLPPLITTPESEIVFSYPSPNRALANIDDANDGLAANDSDGITVDATQLYVSDVLGRITRIESDENADGVVDDLKRYEYDASHRLTRIEENGEFRAYQYNADGKVTQETRSSGYTKTIHYSCP